MRLPPLQEHPQPQQVAQRGTERESLLRGRSNSSANRAAATGGAGKATSLAAGLSKMSGLAPLPGLSRVHSSSSIAKSVEA